jgi:hypothetical protein
VQQHSFRVVEIASAAFNATPACGAVADDTQLSSRIQSACGAAPELREILARCTHCSNSFKYGCRNLEKSNISKAHLKHPCRYWKQARVSELQNSRYSADSFVASPTAFGLSPYTQLHVESLDCDEFLSRNTAILTSAPPKLHSGRAHLQLFSF